MNWQDISTTTKVMILIIGLGTVVTCIGLIMWKVDIFAIAFCITALCLALLLASIFDDYLAKWHREDKLK